MTLLYLALAYITGILAGCILYDWSGLACPLPGWLWLLPLAILPFTPLLNPKPCHRRNAGHQPLWRPR